MGLQPGCGAAGPLRCPLKSRRCPSGLRSPAKCPRSRQAEIGFPPIRELELPWQALFFISKWPQRRRWPTDLPEHIREVPLQAGIGHFSEGTGEAPVSEKGLAFCPFLILHHFTLYFRYVSERSCATLTSPASRRLRRARRPKAPHVRDS